MQRLYAFLFVLLFLFQGGNIAQTFTKVTDTNNPINTAAFPTNYSGAAWVDYNNDGLIDLYATKTFLFKNLGSGNFEAAETDLGKDVVNPTLSNGVSWGDYDNDGDPDCFITGSPSVLYRNDGGIFNKADVSEIDTFDNRGWAASWGDFNNDGNIDLIVTHPAGFLGFPSRPSWFVENEGDETFTHRNFLFTTNEAPHTVATWYDYDLDNDIDLFIGSGPANTSGPDYNFQNKLIETGTANLERITASPIGTDLQNGQVYNFIDFDNDGDQDGFLTNYSNVSDKFFQNNNGVLSSVTKVITTQNQGSNLANVWGDLDNDGFLDVIVTSDGRTSYYRNDQNGNFVSVSTSFTLTGNARGAVLGDYDNDGDLDLFVSGQPSVRGLFRNDTQNGNKWVQFRLKGTVSNRSALGAKVKIKAVINGSPIWLTREINAQNSFNSHSEFRTHFGLGNASIIDSVIISWPSGGISISTDVQPGVLYEVTEGVPAGYLKANFTSDKREGFDSLSVQFKDVSVTDPAMPITSWQWDFNNDGTVDALEQDPVYTYSDLGTFSVRLTVSNGAAAKSIVKTGFIKISRTAGIPVIIYSEPVSSDTTIPGNGKVFFKVYAEDTTGYQLSYRWFKNSIEASSDTFYNYVSLGPAARTDTVKLMVTNQFNTSERAWLIHVDPLTGVDDGIRETFDFNLQQNYPNPFNPSTIIKYSIPAENFVTLRIYNSLGEEIRTLVQENKKEGIYSVNFNAADMSNGVYFYRLTAGKHLQIKKMILLK